MKQRLIKFLLDAGISSRRACEKLILEGKVCVDGEVVLIPQALFEKQRHKILVEGKRLKKKEEKVYFLLNKPPGYLCTHLRPNRNSKIVLDLFKGVPQRLFTIGRLDRQTTGLLLLTNDGEFAHKVIHPSANITKEYLAKTEEDIGHEHLVTLSRGCVIHGTKITPLKVKKSGRYGVKITVGEGKKREVRILLEKAGLNVLSLSRIRIGPLHLGNLPLGTFRPLQVNEKKALLETSILK